MQTFNSGFCLATSKKDSKTKSEIWELRQLHQPYKSALCLTYCMLAYMQQESLGLKLPTCRAPFEREVSGACKQGCYAVLVAS